MTDAELILWLRLEDTSLTDFAADRIEALTKERDEQIEWVKRLADDLIAAEAKLATCEKYRDAYDEMGRIGTQAVRDLEARVERLEEALLWCSGSADFNEGGVARKGWLKVCAPLLTGGKDD